MPRIGRELCMRTFFGKSDPTLFDVLSGTFIQILSSGADAVRFEAKDKNHIFYANRDWIHDIDIFVKQLNGGLMSYPEIGVNVCRIETSYRYLYKRVSYGDIESVNLIKDEDCIYNVRWRDNMREYVLVLGEFGKYKWDELPEVNEVS